MNIRNLSFLNIDDLYSILVERSLDENHKNEQFKRNYPHLLTHMSITFHLTEVSLYEYIFLKLCYGNVTELLNRNIDKTYIEKNFNEIYKSSIESFLAYIQAIKNSNKEIDYSNFLLPSGFITGDCVVTLSGHTLESFIGIEPLEYFVKGSENKCINIEETRLIPSYKEQIYTDDSLYNYTISLFINKFYKYIVEKVTYIDLISDSAIHSILNSTNKELTMVTVRNPYFTIDFNSDGIEDIMNIFEIYKKDIKAVKAFTMNKTSIEFIINTNLGVFIELLNIFDISRFTSLENFSIACNDGLNINNIIDCPEILLDKFENRHSGRMTALITDIDKTYNGNNLIKLLEATPNYSNFKFSITLLLEEIGENNILNNYLNNNSNSKDFIKIKTIELLKLIIGYAKSIYKSIV